MTQKEMTMALTRRETTTVGIPSVPTFNSNKSAMCPVRVLLGHNIMHFYLVVVKEANEVVLD